MTLASRLARAELALGRQNSPVEIVVTGGLPNASPFDTCAVAGEQVERGRLETIVEFRCRARRLAMERGETTIVFGGLPL